MSAALPAATDAAPTGAACADPPAGGRPAAPTGGPGCSPWAIFSECPHCGAAMRPEHAHYRCSGCGWRDSCCD